MKSGPWKISGPIVSVASLVFYQVLLSAFVRGAVLDVKKPGVNGSIYTHCLATGGPLEFSNPFPPELAQDSSFIAVSWFLDSLVEGTWVEKNQLLDYSGGALTLRAAGVAQYEFWGIKIADVSIANSGRYRALALTTQEQKYMVTVVVAEQPQLGSEKLDVTRKVTPDEIVLSCGEIASLGTPPATVTWKASNGSVLPSTFQDGYFTLTLTPEEDDGEFSCTLDPSSPAVHCIPEEELPRWEGSIVLASKTSSAGIGGLIGGIVATIVAVLIVIIIIVFVMRRRKNGNSYNAKEEEARVTRGDNRIPLMDNNESHGPIYKDPTNESTAPIYKDPAKNSYEPAHKGPLASPYMVSGINLPYSPHSGEVDPTTKKLRAPVATHEYETDGTNGKEAPSSAAGNNRKDSDPPRAKPRKIFLTPSMEALDQAGREGVPGTTV